MQTSEQVKLNCSKGSGELSGENPVELSAQLLDLQMSNDECLMSNRDRRTKSECRESLFVPFALSWPDVRFCGAAGLAPCGAEA